MKLFDLSDEYEVLSDAEEFDEIADIDNLETETPPDSNGSGQETPETNNPNGIGNYMMYIILGVVLVLLVVWLLFSGRKNKQRQKEYTEQLDAIGPGNKVKTAGGICGIVVEVCDDNTVILETGSESSGKSYIKMDKELIAQTDAKGPTQIARERAEAAKKAEKTEKTKNAQPAPEEKPEEKPEVKKDPEFTEDIPADESGSEEDSEN